MNIKIVYIHSNICVYIRMNITIVYFAYLEPSTWIDIVTEQLDDLVECGLYDRANQIYMSVVDIGQQIDILRQLLISKYCRIQLTNIYTENVYEYPGIKTLFEISQVTPDIILYFHTKGMCNVGQSLTRKQLFVGTIQNYQTYLDQFQNYPNINLMGMYPHQDGFLWFNFFWVRSALIRQCRPPIITSKRHYYEKYIAYTKTIPIVTWSPIIDNQTLTTQNPSMLIANQSIN